MKALTKKELETQYILADLQGSIMGIVSGIKPGMSDELLNDFIRRIKHAVTISENQLDKLNKQ